MEEFGESQIKKGDFDGALKTAEHVNERSAYDLFYHVGDALHDQGEPQRLHELASHMTDKKRASEFVEAAHVELWPSLEVRIVQPTPCVTAVVDANSGRFTEAWALVNQNNCVDCSITSLIATREYPSNPIEAEREFRKHVDTTVEEYPSNLPGAAREMRKTMAKQYTILGFAEMSEEAAKEGNVSSALRLLDTCQQVSGGNCLDQVREVAWAWTLKGQPRVVLAWAHSLPISQGRGYAVLGIAQAMAHPRPQ
jgi:hypothetical protein